jgi:hypothetical protein
VAGGYQVYAVNPRAVDRYRDRHGQAGAKSDAGDARVLADLVRTDRHQHRRVAGDSELAGAIKVLARSHQSLIWTRQRLANQLPSTLREFYPAALAALAELASPEALAVLAAADPSGGRNLTVAELVGVLGRAGRRRDLHARAEAIHQALQTEQLAAPALLTDASRASVTAIVGVLTSLSVQIDGVHATLSKRLGSTRTPRSWVVCPDSASSSAPGCLASSGMTPTATPTPKARKNYAGTAPITRASGKRLTVLARFVRNRRLTDPLLWWAFCSLTCSPGARACYDRHRARGATHHQALRVLANRWVGILHGCLRHRGCDDELTAWPPSPQRHAA